MITTHQHTSDHLVKSGKVKWWQTAFKWRGALKKWKPYSRRKVVVVAEEDDTMTFNNNHHASDNTSLSTAMATTLLNSSNLLTMHESHNVTSDLTNKMNLNFVGFGMVYADMSGQVVKQSTDLIDKDFRLCMSLVSQNASGDINNILDEQICVPMSKCFGLHSTDDANGSRCSDKLLTKTVETCPTLDQNRQQFSFDLTALPQSTFDSGIDYQMTATRLLQHSDLPQEMDEETNDTAAVTPPTFVSAMDLSGEISISDYLKIRVNVQDRPQKPASLTAPLPDTWKSM